MTYKSLSLLVFSLFFFAAPSLAAIPIPPDSVHQGPSKLEQRIVKKLEKVARDKDPNINGLLSFIFALASFFLPLFAIPAIIFGIISLNKKEPRIWMPIVGLVLGSLFILAFIAILVFALIILA